MLSGAEDATALPQWRGLPFPDAWGPKRPAVGGQGWKIRISASGFWTPPEAPNTTQKSIKHRRFAKKGALRNACLSIFVANVVFLDILVDF